LGKLSWPILRYYPGDLLDGIRTKYCGQCVISWPWFET